MLKDAVDRKPHPPYPAEAYQFAFVIKIKQVGAGENMLAHAVPSQGQVAIEICWRHLIRIFSTVVNGHVWALRQKMVGVFPR